MGNHHLPIWWAFWVNNKYRTYRTKENWPRQWCHRQPTRLQNTTASSATRNGTSLHRWIRSEKGLWWEASSSFTSIPKGVLWYLTMFCFLLGGGRANKYSNEHTPAPASASSGLGLPLQGVERSTKHGTWGWRGSFWGMPENLPILWTPVPESTRFGRMVPIWNQS